MSEGPQIKRKAESLHRWLAGRTVIACDTTRPDLESVARRIAGGRVERVFCMGKHIFLDFGDRLLLHSRVLMKGKWRRLPGRLSSMPAGGWLSLFVGPHTVANLNGQWLRAAAPEDVKAVEDRLGPDIMGVPYPAEAIKAALRRAKGTVAEALLDQSVLAGVENIAKSESLFVARVDPTARAAALDDEALDASVEAVRRVCLDCYRRGGRWEYRVYRKQGEPCESCGEPIELIRQGAGKRVTYLCPACQTVGRDGRRQGMLFE
jgi:endonuclease-8